MKIKIKTLSPVHIGSGRAIGPIEYFVKDGFFYRVDMDGLFKDTRFQKFQPLFIKKSLENRKISEVFESNYDLLMDHILYKHSISKSAENANLIEVKEIVKTAGRAYIPGSSIKGSILSGVIEQTLSTETIKEPNDLRFSLGKVLNKITGGAQNEFNRWIDIRDTNTLTIENVLELSQVKLIGAKTKRTMPILYETIKTGCEFETEIFWKAKGNQPIDENSILKLADNFYRKIHQKEKMFNKIKQSLPSIPKDAILLRIGQGSTAWATSFLILAEEKGIKNYDIKRPPFHKTKGPPTTRKLVSGEISMGWIAIQKI